MVLLKLVHTEYQVNRKTQPFWVKVVGPFSTQCSIDVLWGQLIKLIQVASTSELLENQRNNLVFFKIINQRVKSSPPILFYSVSLWLEITATVIDNKTIRRSSFICICFFRLEMPNIWCGVSGNLSEQRMMVPKWLKGGAEGLKIQNIKNLVYDKKLL